MALVSTTMSPEVEEVRTRNPPSIMFLARVSSRSVCILGVVEDAGWKFETTGYNLNGAGCEWVETLKC